MIWLRIAVYGRIAAFYLVGAIVTVGFVVGVWIQPDWVHQVPASWQDKAASGGLGVLWWSCVISFTRHMRRTLRDNDCDVNVG